MFPAATNRGRQVSTRKTLLIQVPLQKLQFLYRPLQLTRPHTLSLYFFIHTNQQLEMKSCQSNYYHKLSFFTHTHRSPCQTETNHLRVRGYNSLIPMIQTITMSAKSCYIMVVPTCNHLLLTAIIQTVRFGTDLLLLQ